MKADNKYSKLFKNSYIFAVGTFGSKILSFLIIPLYTYVLTTVEFGKIDIFTTTISLLVPFITLLIHEAFIRFMATKELTDGEAVKIGFIVFVGSCILSIFCSLLYINLIDRKIGIYFLFCLICNSFVAIFQNYLKAVGDATGFAIAGLLNTFIFLTSNVILLTFFNMGLYGYLISLTLANLVTGIYVTIKGNLLCKLLIGPVNFRLLKPLLEYSLPLIPNSLMWWVMSAGDKYIINMFLGNSANGIYSISLKLATIITNFFSIFVQAWQLSAMGEYGKEGSGTFYSNIFKIVVITLCAVCIVINTFTMPLYNFAVSPDFFQANVYSPILCVATIFDCLATFCGIGYILSKNTKRAFITTSIGALFNLICNFILIKKIGLFGVCLGTIIGYIVVLIIRMVDMKKITNINYDFYKTITILILVFIQAIIYIALPGNLTIISGLVFLSGLMLLYKKEAILCINLIKRNYYNFGNSRNSIH